jgi:hypothetical protein
MSINNPIMGEGYIPAYQISATPWVTSSIISLGEVQAFSFPQVTRFINVQNVATGVSDEIAVAFTQRGFDTGNYFTLNQGAALRDEIRTDRIFVSCSSGVDVRFQMMMGLTGIPSRQFLIITGSNGFDGVG